MTWVRVDDGFADHPKVLDIGDSAFRLHVCAFCWAARRTTDGLIRPNDLRILYAMLVTPSAAAADLVAELVRARLWELADGGGWMVHDYLEYNPTAEEVAADRLAAAERMKALRAKKRAASMARSTERSSERTDERSGVCSEEVRSSRPDPSPLEIQVPAPAHEAIPRPEVELASLGGLWRKLTDLAPILKPPREFATPTGLAPNEEGPLARQYAQAIAAGFTKADVLALAEWIQAGGIAFRSSQREYICKSFTTALQDAQKWREGGRQPIGKAPRASPQCGPAIPTGPPMSEAQKLIREANRRRKAEKETERTTDDVTDPAP